MSSYIKATVNPDTHEIEQAEWLDDYWGSHEYGVRFPSTGVVYKADDFEWCDDIALRAMRAVKPLGMVITKEQTEVGKRIETREHADGRKDVTVQVHSLDVDLSDPANAEAKKVIEEKIIPAIADAPVTVTVIHKPTNDAASIVCARKNVRAYAEQIVNSRIEQKGGFPFEFCVVEHDGETVRVSKLS